MSIASFNHAAQQAQQWVNELAQDLTWNENRAYHLLRCVLHTLRDWLPPDEMIDLSAQLPVLIRGVYFDGWKPPDIPGQNRSRKAFIERVNACFPDDVPADPERAVAAVFHLLNTHISHGEIVQIRDSMRKSLRELWPAD